MTKSTPTPDEQLVPPRNLTLVPVWGGWSREPDSWTILDEDVASRAYKIWSFAAELSERAIDDVGRGTVVQKLWNAVDQRIRTLHEIYRLNVVKSLLGQTKLSSLDILHYLGVIRPLILKNLKDIRNRVEHQDRDAPNTLECNNLVDSVWYFLRSTDYLTTQKLSGYTLSSGMLVEGRADREEFVSVRFSDDWIVTIAGWFREEFVISTPNNSEPGIELILSDPVRHQGSKDIFVSGSVDPTSALIPHMIREYFTVEVPSGAHRTPSS